MPQNIKHCFCSTHTKFLNDKNARLFRVLTIEPAWLYFFLLKDHACQAHRASGGTRGAAGCLLTGWYLCGCTEERRAVRPWSHFGISEFIFCLSASIHGTYCKSWGFVQAVKVLKVSTQRHTKKTFIRVFFKVLQHTL